MAERTQPGPEGASGRAPSSAREGISQDADLYEENVPLEDEPVDVDSKWLFKRDGQVFGPISTKALLEKMYDGEVLPTTEITPEDEEDFMELRRYGAFRTHLPKVAAHRAEVAEAKERSKEDRKRAVKRRLILAGLAVAVAGAASVAVLEMKRREREEHAKKLREEKERKEAMLREEMKAMLARVTIEPALMDVEIDEKKSSGSGRRRRRGAAAKVQRTGELSRDEVMEGVASRFKGIKKCILAQIESDPESVPPRVVLTFSINNAGQVQNFSLSDRILRKAPINACMGKELSKIQYRSFKGEVRNVVYPLNIGKG